jgi:hypothetical protein
MVFPSIRNLRRVTALAGSAVLLTGGALLAVTAPPALAATATGGSGASLPYAEVQAESSATNGTIIGPSYSQGQLADEASGRKAVTLTGTGEYVTFTTPVATNSIDFRYSIPDTSDGSVYTAPLSLYVNGAKQTDFTLTNAYSWYYGSYPFVNTPSSGTPHHFYDEVHRLFTTTYPAGTTFKLQIDSEDTAASYTIDLADFEGVAAPLAQPAGSVSVVTEGADPTGVNDSTTAFNAAITAAGAGGTVWIPSGTYDIPGHIVVNDVTVEGAGMWYSTITGAAPGFYGNGAPTNSLAGSTDVHLANFAIFGNVQDRDDSAQVNGIGGSLSASTVSNIWIEHMKVGAWMDGPMSNLTFTGMRIRDTTADGINLHGGVTNSTVTDSDIRNTGDDGIALWADASIGADSGDMISDNTVQLQQLANGIAVYGGNNNTVNGNLVVDTGINQGGGITVAQRFDSTPVGLTTVSNNTMIRDGNLDPNWLFGVGALWFDGSQGAVTGPINVTNALIEQSPYEAVQWVEGTVSGVSLNNVTIAGTGTFALQEQTGGAATFANVTATGVNGPAPVYNCEGGGFVVTDGGGNSGISGTPYCGNWPTPVYPPYPASGVTAAPSALSFGSAVTGTTTAAQTVTVSNPTSAAAAVSSIAATGDFAETNTCGTSIAANGSCTVSVTFSPTATGARTGSLTVNAGGVTNTVSLTGTGTAPGPVLAASPASLSFARTIVGSTAAAQTVTVTNSGTSAASVSGVAVTGDYSQTNNCTSIAVGGSCTVTVTFAPTASGTRTGTLSVTSNATNSPLTVGLTGAGINSTTNIAAGQPATASSSYETYVASNVTDGNTSTYWESSDGAAYPQTIAVDLGTAQSVGSVTLDLPPATAWSTRTETLSVLGSTNGTTFSQIVGSAAYTFNPATGNTVTISLPSGTTARYVELSFTANTGWTAAQLSEFEIFPAAGGGSTTGPSLSVSPATLTYASQALNTASAAQTVTVTNTGGAAATGFSAATTGDFAQTSTCGTSLAAGASCTVSVTFTPTAAGARTGNLTITSSAPNSPIVVALSGTGTGAATSTNLALNQPATSSGYTQTYAPGNAVDGNTSTYWESTNSAFPQWLQVDLGSTQSFDKIVLDLPPSTAWTTRTQTLSVLGSTNGTTFTTIVASAAYTFNPSTGNTVTITLPATSDRYVQLNFTANTGWPAGQVSEFQVFNS